MRARSLFGFAFAALIGVSGPVVAQSPLPSQGQDADHRSGQGSADPAMRNPTVRLFQEWLDHMQTSDDATYVKFIQEHVAGFPGGPDQWLDFRHRARGTRLYKVKSTSADGAELWLFDPYADSFVTASAKL